MLDPEAAARGQFTLDDNSGFAAFVVTPFCGPIQSRIRVAAKQALTPIQRVTIAPST